MISLIVTLAVVGLIVWLVITYIPMPPASRTAILIIAVICVVFFVLRAFGLLDGSHDIAVPNLNRR